MEAEAVIAARRKLWERLSNSIRPGATARAKAQADEAAARAEVAKPKPPDPREVIVAAWIASNPAGFEMLCSLIDSMTQDAAAERLRSVDSHARMALAEGRGASLSELRKKLMLLSGQA